MSDSNNTSERAKNDEIKLLTWAAMMGYAPAQLQLGIAMINGEWLTFNPIDAGKMLLLAAKAGNENAKKIWKKACAEKRDHEDVVEIEKLVSEESGLAKSISDAPLNNYSTGDKSKYIDKQKGKLENENN